MKCNVGKADKIFRLVAGLAIITVGIVLKSWWGALGVVPLITAALGWCPLYVPFKIKTCKCKNK